MEFENFVTQLSQVHEAVSVQGKHYTDIHVSGTHIEYTRESNSRESIDIQELFEVYEKANQINTIILRNYITGRKFSPAMTILISAGFYNEYGNKISKATSKSTKWKSVMKILGIIFLIIPVFFFVQIVRDYGKNTDYDIATKKIIVSLIIINIAFFFFLSFLKKEKFQEKTYVAYFTLMILNIGIFPLFNIAKEYHDKNKIKMLYTVGFRSWGTKVKYYDIKVSFYDKFGNPYNLDDSVVNNSKNWIPNLWTDKNKINKFKLKDTVFFDTIASDFSISICNCGAILKPDVFVPKASSFFVDAKLKLEEVDSVYKFASKIEKYQSSQICIKVPVEIGDTTTQNIKDIYYAFEFIYSNFSWSKLRIPGFNFDYTNSQLDYLSNYTSSPQNLYAQHIIGGINNTIFNQNPKDPIKAIEENDTIHLSAVLFDENAAYYIIKNKSTHSLPLFNFNISKYGALNLIEK